MSQLGWIVIITNYLLYSFSWNWHGDLNACSMNGWQPFKELFGLKHIYLPVNTAVVPASSSTFEWGIVGRQIGPTFKNIYI